MKIVFLEQSGEIMNKYICSLGKELCEVNIDFTLCVPKTNRMSDYFHPYITLFEDFSILHSPIQKVLSYQRSWKQIYSYCIKDRVNTIHVSWFTFSPLDYFYLRKLQSRGIHIVITIHDVLAYNAHFYDKMFYKKIYHMADRIIYQAEAYQKELLDNYGLADSILQYIPHGNFMDYAESVSRDEACRKLDLPKDSKIILFFGQIKKNKGISTLIGAFASVADKYPNAILLIAGKVWKDNYDGYQEQIDRLGLGNRVVSHIQYIPDEDIKYYMSVADVVALPYSKIYQSGVLQLATAYEKPVIASRIPGFIEYVVEGETGLLFEEGNSDALAECIAQVLYDADASQRMARAAKERAEREYSWKAVAEKVAEVYQSVEDIRAK